MKLYTFERILLLFDGPEEVHILVGEHQRMAKATSYIEYLLVLLPVNQNFC